MKLRHDELMKWESNSPEETIELGRKLIQEFPQIKLFCLRGDLGSGKTHLSKGIGSALGIQEREIKSPTFITLMEHEGEKKLYHFDFYRYTEATSEEWWKEKLEDDAVCIMEWSQKLGNKLPTPRIEIHFEQKGENTRELTIIKHT